MDADDSGGERLQPAQQRGSNRASPQPEKRVSPSGRSPPTRSGAAGKQRWKVALRQSFQQVMQQKVRRPTGLLNTQGKKEQRMTKTKDNAEPPLIHPLNVEVKQAVPQIHKQAMKQQAELQGDGEVTTQGPGSDQRASPPQDDQLKEKKEQGSQTRLSGPPRPKRLLMLRPGKNKVKQEEGQQEEPRGQQPSGCGAFQNKINSKEKWKRLLRMKRKDSKDNQQRERAGSLTTSQDQGRGHSLKSSQSGPRRASTDAIVEPGNEQRRLSQPAGGWENQENQNINSEDPYPSRGGERIIKVSQHQTPIDGGEPGQQQHLQGSTSYEVETQQYRRPSTRHQLAEEQLHQSQGETVAVITSEAGYSEVILSRGASRRSSEERGMIESGVEPGRITELPIQSDEQSAGFPGMNAEGRRASLVRSSNLEEQITVRPLGIVEQGRIVEAQGARRPESYAGRRQDGGHDRSRMSAISLDHGLLQAPLEARLVTERGSPDRMRHHTSLDRIQRDPAIEHSRHEHPIEVLHGEAPVRATERIHRGSIVERPPRDSSTERLHINSLRHESLVEYPRLDGPVDRVRPDVTGRGAGLMERNGDRLLPKVTQDRAYLPPARLDRGYSYDPQDDRRGRQYQERRYTVGTIEPSYLGGYSERHIYGRLSEPENSRLYSSRVAYSRALDSEAIRSRSIDHELARAYSYSESDYPGRVIDHEQAKIYAERLVADGRPRGIEDYEVRDRGGRYRDAVIAQHSIASAPLADHRSL